MKMRVWISTELAGAGIEDEKGGGYVDHESRAVLLRQNENGSLTVVHINQRYEMGKTTLYAAGHWLAVEDVVLPSKVVKDKVDRMNLE